jgi:DNA-binding GntR family transcriptional regulator
VYTARYPEAARAAERVYADLKTRLLQGDFPLGARLAEVGLAAEFEVSRTPIREALARLWSEGIVERLTDGGYQPIPPDVTTIRDLYEVRIGLEHQSLLRPAQHDTVHDREQLVVVRDDWVGLADEDHEPAPGFVLLDESFHLALAQAAGNPALVEMLRMVNERIRIVRTQDFLTADRIGQTPCSKATSTKRRSGSTPISKSRWPSSKNAPCRPASA